MAKLIQHYPTLSEYFLIHGQKEYEPRVLRPFHKLICDTLQNMILNPPVDDKVNLMILMPPRHGKTFLIRDFVSYGMGIFPDSQFIYTSYSGNLAVAQTGEIRTTMEKEWYRNLFEVQLERSAESFFTTKQNGAVFGVGVGGSITGFGAGIKRPEFGGAIVIDDPMKADDARSQSVKEHTINWYNGVLESRKNYKNTPVVIIMQRLAPDDLINHILNTEREKWRVIQIPALDVDGNALWEETKSASDLKRLKEVDPFTYYAQYQQQPQVEGGNIIKDYWWQYYDAIKADYSVDGLVFITADTALKTGNMNDFTVFQTWHARGKYLDLLDEFRAKMEFPEMLRQSVRYWKKWREYNVQKFYIEDKVSGISLGQSLAEQDIPVTMWTPKAYGYPDDKVGRVKMSTFYIEAGSVRLPMYRTELTDPFKEECSAFNGDDSVKDDRVDALTMAVSIWKFKGGGYDVKAT